jgi:hypothetical protein
MEYEKDSYVAVVNVTVDVSGVIDESIVVCRVLHVGQHDLLVTPISSSGLAPPKYIIPKTECTSIIVDQKPSAPSRKLQPELGDMVLYQDKLSWTDKEDTTIIGAVYEITYQYGKPAYVTVMRDGEMVRLPADNILVLQRCDVK